MLKRLMPINSSAIVEGVFVVCDVVHQLYFTYFTDYSSSVRFITIFDKRHLTRDVLGCLLGFGV